MKRLSLLPAGGFLNSPIRSASISQKPSAKIFKNSHLPGRFAGFFKSSFAKSINEMSCNLAALLYIRCIYGKPFAILLTSILLFTSQVYSQNIESPVLHETETSLKNPDTVTVLFGEQRKTSLLQSISTVYNKQLITTPGPLVLQSLSGRLAGLYTQVTSGAPAKDNEGILLKVRGQTPLILIDGVQRDFTSLDPEEIESVTILKDALSTVMLGQRSSGNVIQITTKKGSGNRRISVTAQSAIQAPINMPHPLSAYDYGVLYNEANGSPIYSQATLDAYQSGSDPYRYPNVDWYKTVLNNSTNLKRLNANLEGSSKDVKYFVSLDYLSNQGFFKTLDSNVYNTNSFVNRYLIRSNLSVNMNKSLTMSLNLFGRIQDGNQPGYYGQQNILNTLLSTPNNAYPVRNQNGSLGGNQNYQNNVYGQTVKTGYSPNYNRDVSIDLEFTQKLNFLASGLWARVKGSFNSSLIYSTNRSKSFAVYNPLYNTAGDVQSYQVYGTNGIQQNSGVSNDRSRYQYFEGALGYDKVIGKHNLNILAIANKQTNFYTAQPVGVTTATKYLPEEHVNYAGRLNYSYADKYFIEAAASYSGYNRFMPGKRYGLFPAVGLGWNIANENFAKKNLPWLDQFKVRASYGTTGRANVGYYVYRQYYFENSNTTVFDYWFGASPSGERVFYELPVANPYATWEKADKLNLGVDITLLKNFTATIEYFNDKHYDLMIQRGRNASILGNSYPNENKGVVRYQGTELTLTYQNNINNLHYFITANGSSIKNKALDLNEVAKPYDWNYLTNQPINSYVGLVADGFFNSQAEIDDANVAKLQGYAARPGDIKYRDLNGDKMINSLDEGPISSLKPLYYYGLSAGIHYKGFDFNFLLQGVYNNEILLTGNAEWEFQNNGRGQVFEHHLDRWTPQTAATATYPRLSLGTNINNHRLSTFWIKKANFLRLKNAEIGYTLPAKLTNKIKLSSTRFFVNGLNLLTISSIDRVDPETYGAAYPITKAINFGINIKL